jgi:hypothetical protein
MEVSCLIYRVDEEENQGTLFNSVREAIDYMKSRASTEKKEWSDYLIKPIEENV